MLTIQIKKAEALEAGMQNVFPKPLPPSAIESLMQEYIINTQQERASSNDEGIKKPDEITVVEMNVHFEKLYLYSI